MSYDDDFEDTDPVHAMFEKHNDEFLKFERVENKLSTRPDLHAFLLLDQLFPGETSDIVSAAQHDEIFLDVDSEDLLTVATEEQIIDLIRCGVRYSEDGICMFA